MSRTRTSQLVPMILRDVPRPADPSLYGKVDAAVGV
jgi:hypothetical protein